MTRTIRARGTAIAAIAIAALLLTLTACFRESDENTNEGTNPSAGAVAVEVLLTDDGIEMPDEVPAGPVLFEVTNAGTAPHGFAIEGIDESLASLTSDQLDTIQPQLEPGTYVVYSPVEGDRDAGLERELTVTEAEDDEGAPLNNDAVGPSEEQDPIGDDGP